MVECHELEFTTIENPLLSAGSTHEINLTSKQGMNLEALQVNLLADPSLNVDKVSSPLPGFSELANSNIISRSDGNEIRVIWYDVNGFPVTGGQNQMTLTISTTEDIYLTELFEIQPTGNHLISDRSDCLNPSSIELQLVTTSDDSSPDLNLSNSNHESIEQINPANDRLFIYPNPVKDKLFIKSDRSRLSSIQHIALYNNLGDIVFTKEKGLGKDQIEINLSQFDSGVYYLKIITLDNEYLEAIVIQ